MYIRSYILPGAVAQSGASPTADPGVTSSIPAWSQTSMAIDCAIISMVILLLLLIQEGLLISHNGKYMHEILVTSLVMHAQEKNVVR